MSKISYTIEQVWGLEPEFKALVGEVINRMLSVPDWSSVDFKETFKVDGTDFEFIFKTSGMATLLKGQAVLGDPTVVTATTFLYGRPYVFSTQLSDYQKSGVFTEELHDQITTSFIGCVIANMARSWYVNDGLGERLHRYAKVEAFDKITDEVDGRLYVNYNDHGYRISFINEFSERIYSVEHIDLLESEDPKNPYKNIFLRYLDDLIIKLLALETIWQGSWTKPLN